MSKRRTRKEKIKTQLKKTEPLAVKTKPETAEQTEKNLIIKDWLKTGLITLGLLIVLGMLTIFLKL
ncbi:hypothetical protein KKE48_01210 [Patescibacteria group bacterium]|nr:hypothetical protein [Patescibacteria group bacterium]